MKSQKKFYILIVLWMMTKPLYALMCVASNVTTEGTLTTTAITTKQQEVLDEYKKYKMALESKKKDMIELLHTVKKIEALMIENQIKRKKILKLWQDRADMYTSPQP